MLQGFVERARDANLKRKGLAERIDIATKKIEKLSKMKTVTSAATTAALHHSQQEIFLQRTVDLLLRYLLIKQNDWDPPDVICIEQQFANESTLFRLISFAQQTNSGCRDMGAFVRKCTSIRWIFGRFWSERVDGLIGCRLADVAVPGASTSCL